MKKQVMSQRFFEIPRLEICRILIDELTHWKSTKRVTETEFFKLVDRLSKVIPHDNGEKK